MDIIFRGQHLHVDDRFREYASERLNKLTRYLPLADHAIVDLRREAKGDRYVVQVTISANGTFLRAEERNFDLLAAVDATADALSQQVKRFKEKKLLRSEQRISKEEMAAGPEGGEPQRREPDTEVVLGRVVRLKRFPMKPMTEAEAIEQMELLNHDFFLFEDADRGTLAVLYRRREGDYGMILPETA